MNRRTRHLVVLLVAVLTASLASLGMYRAVRQMPTHEVEAAQQSVVVAARSMALGTSLTEKDVKVIPWPAANPVPEAIGSIKDVVNRGLIASVLKNEPITTSKLAPADTGAGLSPAIPQGMRAISVKVNDVIGVAGFIVPGSRVDLVATIRRQTDSMTKTVASNVQVLMAGTRKDQEREVDGKTNETSVVTLVVTPEDAELIALAQSEGQIMLVLRNPLDQVPTATTGVRTERLLGLPTPVAAAPVDRPAPRRVVVAPPPVEPPPPPPPPRMVETIKAAKKTQEELKEPGKEVSKEPSKEVIK